MKDQNEIDRDLKHIERVERALDTAINLPGGHSIGLDGIIGLIPVVGDVATAGVSLFLIQKAIKHKLPKRVIIKMVMTSTFDWLVGSIPIVGDLFDFLYKSNVKNARLIRDHLK